MSNEQNRPVISNRDKLLSASVFTRTENDEQGRPRTTYSVSVQRAYQTQEQKGSQEYTREKISLYPDELLRFAELFRRTYNDIILHAQMNKPQRTGGYPAQTMDVDDIPFD